VGELNFKAMRVHQLLAAHSAILEELQSRKVVRSKNNPTGDYAEWLVCKKLGLTPTANSTKGYDAVDSRGRKYQIKGRRVTPTNKSTLLGVIRNYEAGNFDYLVAVVFDQDWRVSYAARVAHADLERFLTFRKHINGHTMSFPQNIFAERCFRQITNELRG
jgi:hypothetical protein